MPNLIVIGAAIGVAGLASVIFVLWCFCRKKTGDAGGANTPILRSPPEKFAVPQMELVRPANDGSHVQIYTSGYDDDNGGGGGGGGGDPTSVLGELEFGRGSRRGKPLSDDISQFLVAALRPPPRSAGIPKSPSPAAPPPPPSENAAPVRSLVGSKARLKNRPVDEEEDEFTRISTRRGPR
jgi:hypothetical protein